MQNVMRINDLEKIRSIADYQFGKGVGKHLFPEDTEIVYSKATGRIRHIYFKGELLATLRPMDGLFSLTLAGAKRIVENMKPLKNWVKVQDEAKAFVLDGKSVFAKHVVDADMDIRPYQEVIVLDSLGNVLGVGKALLSGEEMKVFKRGVAVKIRKGAKKEKGENRCGELAHGKPKE
ncbi:MAG: PUA domain-containing protein [Candidatus Bathyarchaeia archaeon]